MTKKILSLTTALLFGAFLHAGALDANGSVQKLQHTLDQITSLSKTELKADEVMIMVMDNNSGRAVMSSSDAGTQPFGSWVYEPGAVMMPVVLSIALENGTTDMNRTYDMHGGVLSIGGKYKIKDDTKFERLSVMDIIRYSSNVGIAQIALELEGETYSNGLMDFGFGMPSDLGTQDDRSGTIKSADKLEHKLYRANNAYGYGIAVTSAQMLKAYSVFANHGLIVTPHIGADQTSSPTRIISEKTASSIKQILIANVQKGTGKRAAVDGLSIGGKTGTAHIAKNGKYIKAYNSSFYGFAEDGAGHSYTIGVVVRDPKGSLHYGSQTAAPLFGEVVRSMVSYDMLEKTVTTTKESKSKQSFVSPLKICKVIRKYGRHRDAEYNLTVSSDYVALAPQHYNSEVHAVADGIVSFAGSNKVMGKVVVIQHRDGWHTVYNDLKEISPQIKTGSHVKASDAIGIADKILKLELLHNKKPVDPDKYIKFKEK